MNVFHPILAEDLTGIMALGIPMLALFIPIIFGLIKHQQRMAEILHGQTNPNLMAEVTSLRDKVEQLSSRVNQQALVIDKLAGRAPTEAPPIDDHMRQRLGM
jgi:uncharacterized protein YlxW (UPF0749 family)